MLAGMVRMILFALLASLGSAFAQAPPPVPALPDTTRVTNYSISASTCACAVGFQLYGDQTDVDNWVTVSINGVNFLSTDPVNGWALSSPTGSLSTIPRPITDAILTFNNPQTGAIQITGAERPRRLQTFAENQGVSARSLNQLFNTIFAELRESWDRFAAGLFGIPGTVYSTIPAPANCVNKFLNFGGDGKTLQCITNISGLSPLIVPVRSTAASTVTVSAASDYMLCLDPTGNTIVVTLPASPTTGLNFLIKDCTGQSPVHNITIQPAAGNIDGNASFVMNVAYQSTGLIYNGTQWSLN